MISQGILILFNVKCFLLKKKKHLVTIVLGAENSIWYKKVEKAASKIKINGKEPFGYTIIRLNCV